MSGSSPRRSGETGPDDAAGSRSPSARHGASYTAAAPRRHDERIVAHARRIVELLFGAVGQRAFDVLYWDGSVESTASERRRYAFVINRPGALRRMLLPPSELSIAEGFLSNDVDIDGDLESALAMEGAINTRLRSPRVLAALLCHLVALPRHDPEYDDVRARRAEHVVDTSGRRHEAPRDRAAIRFHYDVGNDFYALWLDERMVYSCAYFPADAARATVAEVDAALEEAQRAKLDLICRKLRLRPGDRLLDVGCGWGALVMHAAEHFGVTALGITLSDAQASLARQRIAAAGLGARCRVEIRDYRQLPPEARFDRIASVGMVEHVGADMLPVYFSALHEALVPGGLLLNHGIVSVEDAHAPSLAQRIEAVLWRRDAFIDQYVFPDGKLEPLRSVIGGAEGAGFETRDLESLREHYVLTLRAWVERLARNAERAVALTDERTYRIWRLYMIASAHGFSVGRINVVQALFSKRDSEGRSGVPLRRDYMLNAS